MVCANKIINQLKLFQNLFTSERVERVHLAGKRWWELQFLAVPFHRRPQYCWSPRGPFSPAAVDRQSSFIKSLFMPPFQFSMNANCVFFPSSFFLLLFLLSFLVYVVVTNSPYSSVSLFIQDLGHWSRTESPQCHLSKISYMDWFWLLEITG